MSGALSLERTSVDAWPVGTKVAGFHFKRPAIYILASKRNGTLYIGVTSDLPGRVSIHKQDLVDGFTKRYGVHTLVYYELYGTMPDAIAREKQHKKFSRARKIALIEANNADWRDLYDDIQK